MHGFNCGRYSIKGLHELSLYTDIRVYKIKMLNLSYNKIKLLPFNVFYYLIYLKEITLNNNYITTINYELFNRNLNLTHIVISCNSITHIGFQFHKLNKLEILYVDTNRLYYIRQEIYGKSLSRNLNVFQIDHNPIIFTCPIFWLNNTYYDQIHLRSKRSSYSDRTVFEYIFGKYKDQEVINMYKERRSKCAEIGNTYITITY